MQNIEKQTQSGAGLTQQPLGVACGKKYEVKPTDINELIVPNGDMFQRTRREVRIIPEFAADILSVRVDRNQMEQVFLNLFINALQAIPAGGDIFSQPWRRGDLTYHGDWLPARMGRSSWGIRVKV